MWTLYKLPYLCLQVNMHAYSKCGQCRVLVEERAVILCRVFKQVIDILWFWRAAIGNRVIIPGGNRRRGLYLLWRLLVMWAHDVVEALPFPGCCGSRNVSIYTAIRALLAGGRRSRVRVVEGVFYVHRFIHGCVCDVQSNG